MRKCKDFIKKSGDKKGRAVNILMGYLPEGTREV